MDRMVVVMLGGRQRGIEEGRGRRGRGYVISGADRIPDKLKEFLSEVEGQFNVGTQDRKPHTSSRAVRMVQQQQQQLLHRLSKLVTNGIQQRAETIAPVAAWYLSPRPTHRYPLSEPSLGSQPDRARANTHIGMLSVQLTT
eukprot:442357-Rhodomonas_salina.1